MKKRAALMVVMGLLFFCNPVKAAKSDIVDVSNHNGYMTVDNFVDMRNNYGTKAVITKISEGTFYHDYTSANNIKTAQQAGLYINGYHFARYQTVDQAKAEANYACQQAKADGLPIGAVLVADVEADQQKYLSGSQLDACNQAFTEVVQAYGYRPDVYTMGRWVNSKLTIKKGGWIASYPFNPDGKNWYSQNNAWQYRSDQRFNGSYGLFDVSQAYNNYYFADQTPVAETTPQKPAPQPTQPTSWTDALGDRWHSETGTYHVQQSAYLRWGARTGSSAIGLMTAGTTVKYNAYSIHDGYVWIRQPRADGTYAYLATGEAPFGVRTSYWGSFTE